VIDDLAVHYICRALVLPPGGPLLLALAGIVLLKRAPRTGRALAIGGILVTLVLALPAVADALTRLVERYPPLDASKPLTADVIVVLAGGIDRHTADGQPLPRALTLQRLAAGAELARTTGLPLLLSGGVVEAGPAEAEVMERTLERAFALHARWLETRSRTTHENARETARLLQPLGIHRVLLVTSANHMRRSVTEFEAAGLSVVPAPVAGRGRSPLVWRSWLPLADALATSYAALYEFAGIIVAALDPGA
jgi:uncharacterized SAM-binding protein YcdF (DUF218 family)